MAKSRQQHETAKLSPEQVVQDYAALVYKIAHTLSRRTVDPVEDLIQVGMIGLLESHRRYDPTQAASFKTYATHFVNGHIRHYLRDRQQLLKGPRSLQELTYRVQMAQKELKQKYKRLITPDDVAQHLGIAPEQVDDALNYARKAKMLWLDQRYGSGGEDESRTLLDTLPDEESGLQQRMDTRILIDEGLRQLSELDQNLLRLRYFEDLTQANIARHLDMSQMDVCRKLKQAEKRLRKILYTPTDL
jgi:RNA polymerase sigma factor (sigma-70 family)